MVVRRDDQRLAVLAAIGQTGTATVPVTIDGVSVGSFVVRSNRATVTTYDESSQIVTALNITADLVIIERTARSEAGS